MTLLLDDGSKYFAPSANQIPPNSDTSGDVTFLGNFSNADSVTAFEFEIEKCKGAANDVNDKEALVEFLETLTALTVIKEHQGYEDAVEIATGGALAGCKNESQRNSLYQAVKKLASDRTIETIEIQSGKFSDDYILNDYIFFLRERSMRQIDEARTQTGRPFRWLF